MAISFRIQAAKSVAMTCIFGGLGLALGFAGGNGYAQSAAPTEHRGLSVEVLGAVSEESLKAQIGLEGYILRMRAVTLDAGGQVKKHDHAKRPGLFKMISGELIEGTANGEHKFNAGSKELIIEKKDTEHWVFNRTNEPATGLVCDIAKLD